MEGEVAPGDVARQLERGGGTCRWSARRRSACADESVAARRPDRSCRLSEDRSTSRSTNGIWVGLSAAAPRRRRTTRPGRSRGTSGAARCRGGHSISNVLLIAPSPGPGRPRAPRRGRPCRPSGRCCRARSGRRRAGGCRSPPRTRAGRRPASSSSAVGLALRDRPVALVAVREERPARVGEQDLEPTIPRPEEHDSGACPWCHDPTTFADLR